MEDLSILRHVQSFLDVKEAARTTLLSKSWYSAWSMRPNLDFDHTHFPHYGEDEFLDMANKTMQRYEARHEDLNLIIDTLRLLLVNHERHNDVLVKELMVKALKLRAVSLDITLWDYSFAFPHEVLRSQTLASLSLCGSFTVDLAQLSCCSRLKSLNLNRVILKGDLFRDLISRSPIEELTLASTSTLFGVYPRRTPFYDLTIQQYKKLRYLRLDDLDIIDALSTPNDLWPKFPYLKELVIWDNGYSYNQWSDVRICSPSLESITIRFSKRTHLNSVNVEFDVPNLRKFNFKGYDLPRLDFKTTTSRAWESDILVRYCCLDEIRTRSASWLSLLNQLVRMLSRSRVSLCVDICYPFGNYGYNVRDVYGYVGDGLAAVEKLTIMGSYPLALSFVSFLDALFWSCRPKWVIIERRCVLGMEEVDVGEFLLLSSVPWKTLLDPSRKHHQFLRFQLIK